MSTNIKTSIFLDFLLLTLTLNQPLRSPQKKPTVRIFAEEKIHNLPVESDQCFKSSLSLRMVLHKKMSLFLPSHGNLLPETEQGKPKKVPKSFSLEFVFFSAGGRESFLGHKKPFCVHQPPKVCVFDFRVCC